MSGCRKVRGEGKSVSMIPRGIPVGLRSEKIVPRSFSFSQKKIENVESILHFDLLCKNRVFVAMKLLNECRSRDGIRIELIP